MTAVMFAAAVIYLTYMYFVKRFCAETSILGAASLISHSSFKILHISVNELLISLSLRRVSPTQVLGILLQIWIYFDTNSTFEMYIYSSLRLHYLVSHDNERLDILTATYVGECHVPLVTILK